MNTQISAFRENLQLGEIIRFQNMAIIPLFAPDEASSNYLTLHDAITQQAILISEVSESGTVPNLKVENRSPFPVLMLDGEELVGAKQNRVLNTTVLLRELTVATIPVSCTEHGRWSGQSGHPSMEYGYVHSPRTREKKAASVSASLVTDNTFQSNQSQVWDEVSHRSREASFHSPTGAMRDVFEHVSHSLEYYCQSFQSLPRQRGIMVFVNGKVSGLDWISSVTAY